MIKKIPLRFESDRFKVSIDDIHAMQQKYCVDCTVCNGTGILGEEEFVKCICLIRFNNAYALAHAHIPPAFRDLTKQNIDPGFQQENAENLNRVAQYTKQHAKALETGFGLFIQGGNGTGKSFIATLILKRALEDGYSGYFVLMSDLVDASFAALRDPEVKRDLEKVIQETDFLVVDEIDKGFQDQHDNVQRILLPLFKKRCDYLKKPLIVTSNVMKSDIAHTVGKTIAAMFSERLAEITFTGNYRPQILGQLESEFFDD